MDQPRVPAGSPEGGQFASKDGGRLAYDLENAYTAIRPAIADSISKNAAGVPQLNRKLGTVVNSPMFGTPESTPISPELLDNFLTSAVARGELRQSTVDAFHKAFEAHERHRMETDDDHYNAVRTYYADGWKDSSTSAESLVLKHAVKNELGAGGRVYDPDSQGAGAPLSQIQARAMVARMYRETQAELKQRVQETGEMSSAEFRIGTYRGLSDAGMHVGAELDPKDNSRVILHRGTERPVAVRGVLEAWSGSKEVAQSFGPLASDEGVVVTTSVPIKDVLTWYRGSTWRSEGSASQSEREFIVINGVTKQPAPAPPRPVREYNVIGPADITGAP